MVLVLQLGRLDLLKLLRQGRHDDCRRQGGELKQMYVNWKRAVWR